jgi:REP element-mobilizing transposase RayT
MQIADTLNTRTFYRRKLPHWQPDGAVVFLTWRLKDSLPQSALTRLEETRKLLAREIVKRGETSAERKVRHFKKLFALADEMLDRANDGPLWLKLPSVASLVEDALLNRYEALYTLWAYVVMANHVHVFVQPKPSSAAPESNTHYVQLSEITKRLKGYTSREANKLIQRTGQAFWQIESFDHWARDEAEFYRIIAYIENNPVKAGLTLKPEEWRWSSAHERMRRGLTDVCPLT